MLLLTLASIEVYKDKVVERCVVREGTELWGETTALEFKIKEEGLDLGKIGSKAQNGHSKFFFSSSVLLMLLVLTFC